MLHDIYFIVQKNQRNPALCPPSLISHVSPFESQRHFVCKVPRRSLVDTRSLLVLGSAKCSSAFVDARCVAILLNVDLLCFCRFESLSGKKQKSHLTDVIFFLREGHFQVGNIFERSIEGILGHWDRIEGKVERMQALMIK